MPELPEVETITRELNAQIAGRRIEGITIFRADALGRQTRRAFRDALIGCAIRHCSRRGKFLIFRLEPRRFLVAHLRMTGKFALSAPLPAPHPHHRLWFHLDDGRVLVYQDLRCLGTLEVVERLSSSRSLRKLGVDPLSRRFSAAWLGTALAASRSPLKHWMMDQSKIAGLGNIYVSEILFAAGLAPTLPSYRLDTAGIQRLVQVTRRILRKAIRNNGTTISDFRRVDEKRGEFQHFLKVYGKAGNPCPRCRTPIARIRQQQRSTFFCPACQPLPDTA
jgi:formamidopyrimidine-DNA glycosylase